MGNELKGYKVFIAEYYEENLKDYGLLSELGAEVIWGRDHGDAANKYTEADMIRECRDVDGLIMISRDGMSRAILEAAPKLRVIAKCGIGVDHIPLADAAELGVLVTNTAMTVVNTVSESAFCLMLAAIRKLPQTMAAAKGGRWRIPEFHYKMVRQKTIGLLGFGNIAQAFARRLSGWEVEVLAHDPFVDKAVMEKFNVKKVEFNELLQKADILSVHMPLLDSTKGIMGEKEFALMKKGAYFINTARGKIVQEAALIKALKSGHLAGAGLDVLEQEPANVDNPLFAMDNVIITPHNSGTADESIVLTVRQVTKNCADALLGKEPDFILNKEALPKWRERFIK